LYHIRYGLAGPAVIVAPKESVTLSSASMSGIGIPYDGDGITVGARPDAAVWKMVAVKVGTVQLFDASTLMIPLKWMGTHIFDTVVDAGAE
jgi:hypothetical protein